MRDTLMCKVEKFPCRYLGIPLSIYKLKRLDEQRLIDAVAARIPLWKGRMLNVAGWTALARATLSAIPVHVAIAIGISPWAIEQIDKLRRAFIWCGEQTVGGGKCKVAWEIVCRPRDLGGLGIVDLRRACLALRARWQWKLRTDQNHPGTMLPDKKDARLEALFRAATLSVVGSGESTLFWSDNWLDGTSIRAMAPALFRAVATRKRKATVSEALPGRAWVRHITGAYTVQVIAEFLKV